ncbi:MAG: hypothetical protein EOO77_04410 [Oxalobacteraceae bacterium]|nr:MAG: hypothetical protein EOO77_04410 [Oxalobacteraceae bacterium]
MENFSDIAGGGEIRSAARRSLLPWIAAHVLGGALLAWVAVANGYPMIFADTGGYLRVGNEFHYLPDRPITYGLLIAPFARFLGLWAIVVLQGLFASWLIGEVLVAVTGRRSAPILVLHISALAALSSLPWFVGQIMPDLFTALMALTLYLLIFVPYSYLRAWTMAALLAGQIAMHLSNIPVVAALIATGGALLVWRHGWKAALCAVAPALAALILALLGLCSINLLVVHSFRPSQESSQFLVARSFDGKIGQPVLDRICRAEKWRMCDVRTFVEDPARPLPGQDYLWAPDSPRGPLKALDPERLGAEEGAFVKRVLREDPVGTVRVAASGWRDQLFRARAGDGMIAYAPHMQVVQQIRRYLPDEVAGFEASRQNNGTLQRLAAAPDRAIGLLLLLLAPFVLWFSVRRGDERMSAFVIVVLMTVFTNAAVCGILSGPSDRYQSRVLWLVMLMGLIACTRKESRRENGRQFRGPEARGLPVSDS